MNIPDEIKVSLVTVFSIFTVSIVGRMNSIDFGFMTSYGPVWLFLLYVMIKSRPDATENQKNPLYWSMMILGLTVMIIAFHMLF